MPGAPIQLFDGAKTEAAPASPIGSNTLTISRRESETD
jgi:hypothetical protein